MSVIEIVGAILLIVSCVSILILVLSQDSSKGLSQSLTGSSGDNYFQKNSARTKEAILKRATKTATIILFVVTVAVNVFAIFGKKAADDNDENVIDLSEQFQMAAGTETEESDDVIIEEEQAEEIEEQSEETEEQAEQAEETEAAQ